jgi:hypothetical protein
MDSGAAPQVPSTAEGAQDQAATEPGADDLTPMPDAGAADVPMDAFASNFGAASAPQSSSPFMIGDSFGGSSLLYFDDSLFSASVEVPRGGGAGPQKICENSSPIPVCRAFVNYHFFANAVRANTDFGAGMATEMDVHRTTLGWEQCFADGLWSIELRVPFASTIDNEQIFARNMREDIEFGQITTTLKALLYQTDTWATSAGLSVNAPTANDFRVLGTPNGPVVLQVNDQSTHLQPFLGYLATPDDYWFIQAFAQLDIDTRGNDILYRSGGTLDNIGTAQDQTLAYLDVSIGYWLYRDYGRRSGITGIAPMLELHYTTTLEDTDVVTSPDGFVEFRNPYNRQDVLNCTIGMQFLIGDSSVFTIAGSAPTEDFPDRFFDGEVMALYSWLF